LRLSIGFMLLNIISEREVGKRPSDSTDISI
jgi:hypothetical protein